MDILTYIAMYRKFTKDQDIKSPKPLCITAQDLERLKSWSHVEFSPCVGCHKIFVYGIPLVVEED